MMPQYLAQNSGLFSSGPLQPGHGSVSISAWEQILQSSPHGAIIAALNMAISPFAVAVVRLPVDLILSVEFVHVNRI